MPVNNPNGSQVSEIILPNGVSATRVFDPNGNRVFGQAPGPDSVVTRPSDNGSYRDNTPQGVRIESNQEWEDIGARLSANVDEIDTAYIYRVQDSVLMGEKDISNLSSGDVFVMRNVNLSKNTKYNFLIGGAGEFTVGYYSSPNFPYTSDDGDLSIVNGALGPDGSFDNLYNIDRVGDIGSN